MIARNRFQGEWVAMGPDRTVEVAGVQYFCKSGLVLSRIESRVFWRTFNIFQRIIFDTTSLKIFTQFGQHDPDLIESGWRNGERNAETNGEGCVQIFVYNIQGSSGMIYKTPVNCRRCNFQAVYIVWERHDVFHEAFFHACYFEWTCSKWGTLTCPNLHPQPEVIPHLRGIPTPALFWLVCVTRRFRCNDQCWDQAAVGATSIAKACAGCIHCECMKMHINIDVWNFHLYTCTNRDRYR